ncbi:Putative S-adenosyl-L-methionine-dependent methyltransferase [Mycobacterium talmoniae]|uniref:S-adenosyl-L-methionine-dependent methyltransferase n=1 Tax=Mycobacterium talmoniae TaxID=1858794 RepID=A0A2S8BDN5_9MYCO|nr:Putative S-adenosyl-L-methionine-dependent methyltransferase [Mycobacterium talmoniae]
MAIDLRHDWAAALTQAGFDPGQRSAWSAEGLLPFLPPEAQDRLLDHLTALSTAGSRLATENLANAGESVPMMRDRMHEAVDRWRQHGFDVDMTDLWYAGDRHDVIDYLNSHGWDAAGTSVAELTAAHGISTQTDDEDEAAMFRSLAYVTARRT